MAFKNYNSYNNSLVSKVKSMKISLILIVVLSLVNVVSITFADTYFIFSSYISQLIALAGAEIYAETGEIISVALAFILAVISILPYLFSLIFSKNTRYGWFIVAFVFFAIDCVIFTIDFIAIINYGGIYWVHQLTGVLIRAYCLFSLAMAILYSVKLSKQPKEQAESLATSSEENVSVESSQEGSSEFADCTRIVSIKRKSSMSGAALKFNCLVNGEQKAKIANGQTINLEISGNRTQIIIEGKAAIQGGMYIIEPGNTNVNLLARLKMHALNSEIIIEEK